jgi:hypothetical protein
VCQFATKQSHGDNFETRGYHFSSPSLPVNATGEVGANAEAQAMRRAIRNVVRSILENLLKSICADFVQYSDEFGGEFKKYFQVVVVTYNCCENYSC